MATETWSVPETARRPSCSLGEPGLVEVRFGVTGCEVDEEGRYCTAGTATWGSSTQGVQQVGALAILVDHVLGEVGNHPQPPGFLPLTTQLSIDVLVRPPRSGELSATARRVLDDGSSSHCQARHRRARDAAGDRLGMDGIHAGTRSGPTSRRQARLLTAHSPVPDDRRGSARGAHDGEGRDGHADAPPARTVVQPARNAARWDLGVRESGAEPLTTTHLDIAVLRAGRTADVHPEAHTVHIGRTLGLVEVNGLDDDGRLGTTATVTGRR